VARRASAKQGIFYVAKTAKSKIKSGTAQKEKRHTRKPAAFELPEQKPKANSLLIIIISHIQHFFNAFQPVAYRLPAVMCLCCNVRQREPLNVPQ
jgi:hypothetical protein